MYAPTLFSFLVASAFFSASNAADIAVQVGSGGLQFTPASVTAAAGDTVTFQFFPGDHTATQSSLNTPCSPIAGGFNSGARAGSTTTGDPANTFQITVNDTQPIWVFCSTGTHCLSGMVFAVNPASAAQLTQFQQNAVTPGGAPSTAATGATTTTGGGGSTGTSSRASSAASSTSSVCVSSGSGYAGGSSCGAGFATAKVLPALLTTAFAVTFGALLV